MITAEKARDVLEYCQQTGVLRWRVDRGPVKAGQIAGNARPDGYRQLTINGKAYLAHRVVWLLVRGEWPNIEIDHINGNKSDNRIENLRDVAKSVNLQNQFRPHKHNRFSKYMGVSWDRERNKWRASLTLGGKNIKIGRFATEEAAHKAYLVAKARLHEGYVERAPT